MPIPSRPVPELAQMINRHEIEQLFSEAHFPADRQQVVDYARDHFASADTLAVLDSLPKRLYTGPSDIAQAIVELVASGSR